MQFLQLDGRKVKENGYRTPLASFALPPSVTCQQGEGGNPSIIFLSIELVEGEANLWHRCIQKKLDYQLKLGYNFSNIPNSGTVLLYWNCAKHIFF